MSEEVSRLEKFKKGEMYRAGFNLQRENNRRTVMTFRQAVRLISTLFIFFHPFFLFFLFLQVISL